MRPNLQNATVADLLRLHHQVLDELHRRQVVRQTTHPTRELAVYLCCAAFGWRRAKYAHRGYSAIGPDETYYEVRARHRNHHARKFRRAFKDLNLTTKTFDMLAGVIFTEDYRVDQAALIPWQVAKEQASLGAAGYRLNLGQEVWRSPGVVDITGPLRAALDAGLRLREVGVL